jgi:hypothetical protein
VVVFVWQLDLPLSVQSVPIILEFVSSYPAHGDVYSMQHYLIKFVSDLRQVGGNSMVICPMVVVESEKPLRSACI